METLWAVLQIILVMYVLYLIGKFIFRRFAATDTVEVDLMRERAVPRFPLQRPQGDGVLIDGVPYCDVTDGVNAGDGDD